jgi:hypothetical protein
MSSMRETWKQCVESSPYLAVFVIAMKDAEAHDYHGEEYFGAERAVYDEVFERESLKGNR